MKNGGKNREHGDRTDWADWTDWISESGQVTDDRYQMLVLCGDKLSSKIDRRKKDNCSEN
jgi:hypothetical protein